MFFDEGGAGGLRQVEQDDARRPAVTGLQELDQFMRAN